MALEGFQAQGPGTVGILAVPVTHRHDEAHVGNAVVVLLDAENLGNLHQVARTEPREGGADHDFFGGRQIGFRRQ